MHVLLCLEKSNMKLYLRKNKEKIVVSVRQSFLYIVAIILKRKWTIIIQIFIEHMMHGFGMLQIVIQV